MYGCIGYTFWCCNNSISRFGSHGKLSRFNIQLVIDGSGSLEWGNNATDPKGLRYDAINLFLALLTNDGNDIGVVVFDDNSDKYLLNTGLSAVSGKDEKIALSDRIRKAGTGNDTDERWADRFGK